MSTKAIFKHFQKDTSFETDLQDGVLAVSTKNPEDEVCEFFLFESEDPVLGKKVMILAPVFEGSAQVDFNSLLTSGGFLATNIASWQRFGMKVLGDDLYFRKFISSDQDPKIVRRQAVMMAWAAKELGNLLGK